MAQKAATIFIIDVAPTMQIKQEGSKKTYLQTSIDAVATMLQDKVCRVISRLTLRRHVS